jgi:membrane protein DedA with SNARE-associated domain
VFAVTWLANVGSAGAVYLGGRTLGRQFFTGRIGRRLLLPRRLARIEHLYRAHGTWGIFLSRFIPGVRAVVPPFAGIAGLGAVRTMIPVAAASAVWYGLLTAIVVVAAGTIEDVVRLVAGLNWGLLLAVLVAAFAAVVVARRRRDRRA